MMIQPVPSPRYRELQADGEADDGSKHSTLSDRAEPFLGYEDEERAWSDITARDPEMANRRMARRQRIWAAVMSIRSLVDTVLLVVILGLLLEREWQRPSWYEVGGDITWFAPKISQQIKSFVPDHMFIPTNGSEFFTDAVRSRWLSIVPKGLGYVQINSSESYNNLPTPLAAYPDSTFTTSVTHQLHCLHSIVGVVAAYTSNQLDKLPEEGAWHVSHCFDYLRQSIMCCGDMALEGQQTTFPPGFIGSDGWDAKHICKDYNQVLAHLEKNSVDDERWI